jgi:spore coat assembly protein SafA
MLRKRRDVRLATFNLTYSKGSAKPIQCDGRIYTVKPGDTLWEISRKTRVPLDVLIAANPQIKNPDLIRPGDKICIPKYDPCPCPEPDKHPSAVRYAFLSGTGASPDSLGFAIVKPKEPAWVAVAGFNLPDPCCFGQDFDTYKAWVVESSTFSRFRLDMRKIAEGIWLAEGDNGDLLEYEQILVTPETNPGITTPTGPAVLKGMLNGKF